MAIGFLFVFLNTSSAKEKNNSQPILEIVSFETAKNTTDLQRSNGFIKEL